MRASQSVVLAGVSMKLTGICQIQILALHPAHKSVALLGFQVSVSGATPIMLASVRGAKTLVLESLRRVQTLLSFGSLANNTAHT